MSRRSQLVCSNLLTLVSLTATSHVEAGSPPIGDVNGDCRVYLDDYVQLVAELAGPGVEPGGAGWEDLDLNADGNVDLRDFGHLQYSFTGANPGTWSALVTGVGEVFPLVDALAVYDDGSAQAMYVGGYFRTAGGVPANGIAKWNGTSWSALGSGVSDEVFPTDTGVEALKVFDDGGGPALYVGGTFTTAGGVSANNIAKWYGANWSALGTGVRGGVIPWVVALAVFDDGGGPALYAGGKFTTAGGVPANGIAKWDGATWSGLGAGMNDWVVALAVFDDSTGRALYAGGSFTSAGGVSAKYIAKWDGTNWSALGSEMDNDVFALTVFDNGGGPALYAGGIFSTAGGVSANHVAMWDGANWSPVGTGFSGDFYPGVGAFAVFDDGTGPALYAGGRFTSAGGITANGIAKWNGSTWSALGEGLNNSVVIALTVFDDGGGPALYAGGEFTTAGGVPANHVARWTPATLACSGPRPPIAFSLPLDQDTPGQHYYFDQDGADDACKAKNESTACTGIEAAYDGHRGIDFVALARRPVYAAAAGTIIKGGKVDGHPDGCYPCPCGTADGEIGCKDFIKQRGNYIILDHGDGFRTVYLHLEQGTLTEKLEGDPVGCGDYLGAVGKSGLAEGYHLHFGAHAYVPDGQELGTPFDPYDGFGYWPDPETRVTFWESLDDNDIVTNTCPTPP